MFAHFSLYLARKSRPIHPTRGLLFALACFIFGYRSYYRAVLIKIDAEFTI